jgi:DNA-binding NarL/FixJ family response regulator
MTKNRSIRILVADDHALMRRGIRGLLQDQPGWRVVAEAGSGKEAVDQASRLKPDVAILDVTMPGLDGLEATRRLREAAPGTKILILTMHESRQMVRRLFQAGANGYVLKSDFPRSLVTAVKEVSHDKRFLSDRVAEIVLDGFLDLPDASPEFPLPQRSQRKPTHRETEIIRLLVAGKTHKEIAVELSMAVRTVETHRARIMWKLGLNSFADLVQYAIGHGHIRVDPVDGNTRNPEDALELKETP